MNIEDVKEQLGDELCDYCPWKKGEIPHLCDAQCDGNYCQDAFEAFMDDNRDFFDDDTE